MRFLFCLLVLLVAGCGGGGGSSGGGGETPPQRDVVVYVPGGGWISVADPSEVPPDIASLPRLAAEAGYDYVQLDYPVGECCFLLHAKRLIPCVDVKKGDKLFIPESERLELW